MPAPWGLWRALCILIRPSCLPSSCLAWIALLVSQCAKDGELAQVYKQQQAAVATEGSKETRFFEGALPYTQGL